MRCLVMMAAGLALCGCTAFPRTAEQGTVEVSAVVNSIQCELAAVANSSDHDVQARDIMNWNAATDLDLTLVRSVGADGNVKVTAPYGLAGVSTTPNVGISDTDTRINHIKFANSFARAVDQYKTSCVGFDPSETGMGLANWFIGTVKAVPQDSLVGISYTKQFEVVAKASARFGYTLVPVTNTVAADAGGAVSHDYTNRFTIALTPPPPKTVPLPLRVYVVNWKQKPAESQVQTESVPTFKEGAPPQKQARRAPQRQQAQPGLSPRLRVLQDPELNLMLQRKSPIVLSP